MKPFSSVCRATSSLFVFEHGLGDLINYLPVHKEFCKQTNRRVVLAASAKRQFNLIDNNIIALNGDTSSLRRSYDYIYRVHYPDSTNSIPPIEFHNESAKPYLCAFYELGMKDFTWKPYRMINKYASKSSNRVGVHLSGHTGMNRKFCPRDVIVDIWNEIKEAGYEPFETHMIPQFANEYNLNDKGICDDFSFLNKTNSLRFEEPNLVRMIEEIGKCKYFIGIDSGPIYLASALLGCDKLIGLINLKRHDHFLPKHISTVNVKSYEQGSIKRILKQKDW
jgi:hypothetical protein